MMIDKKNIKFAAKVKEIDRQYEQNNKLYSNSIDFVLMLNITNKNYNIDGLMGGQGLFVGGSISAFTLASNHDYHFINWNGSNVLR